MKCLYVSCLLFFLPIVFSQRCPVGWSLYQDNCFRLFTDNKNMNDARLACQSEQGDLAIITSVEMNTFLADFTEAAGSFAWIGLNDMETEGRFEWIDGTALDPALNVLWGSSAPNNNNNEDCVVLRNNRVWNDVDCYANKNRICQRPNDTPLKCDEANGWVPAAGKCFKFHDLENSWDDARRYCQQREGDLISIQSDEEQNLAMLLAQINQASIWIGASDKISSSAGLYTWPDGSSLGSVTYWAPGQPDNQFFSLGGNCVGILDTATNGGWSTAPCTSQRKFVCEKDEGTCPTGWRIHGGQCYQFNTYSAMTWTDAKHTCEVQGAFLASILSGSDNAFVVRQFDDLMGIGVTDVWIGISDYISDGQFAWVEGATVSYTKWNVGMPIDNQHQPDCGTIYLGDSSGSWSTANCFLPQAFVCKTPVGQPVTPLNPITAVGSCPAGWNLFGDYCYFIETTSTLFNDAETLCEAKGAKLTSIHSAEEQSYLSLRTVMMNKNLWIGLHDISNEGNFEWVDSTPLDFTNWNTNEPNNYGDGEDCVHLRPGETTAGTWNDHRCDYDNCGYICKMDKACEVLDTASTDNNYYYRYHPSQANLERIEFKVKASNDVHISLSATSSDNPAMYEVVISGWGNSNSAIRRCAQCSNEVYVSTPNFLSPNEFRGFWITYDLGTGKLDVGKEGQSDAFMTWTDPSPLDVKYVGYSTGFGSTGEFQFCNLYAGVASTPAPRPTPTFDARCGQGWEYEEIMGQCFYFAPSDYRTWDDAREQCMLGGGDLISIVSAQEQTYLNARMVTEREPHIWIGANDISANGGWVWSDGSPFKFLNWNAGEPNDQGDGENCAEVYTSSGRWNDIQCASTQGYACKKNGYLVSHFTVYPNAYLPDSDILVLRNVYPEQCAERCVMEMTFDCRSFDYNRNTKECMLSDNDRDTVGRLDTAVGLDYYQIIPGVAPPTPPATLAPGYRCRDGWSGYGDYCYQAQPGDGTWTEALTDCRTMGADLISIHDMNENDYIVSLMLQNGLTGQVWSGMSDRAVSLTYEWSDLSPVTFTNWNINEPNNYEGKNEDCVEVYASGQWNDQDCEDRNHYICKQMKQNLGPTQFPITPNGCDAGWVAFESSCYKIEESVEASWDQAKTNCMSMGGNLIVLNERFEQSFLSSQLGLQNGGMFWIGMSEGNTKGTYQWVNGAPITFTHWDRAQPDDSRGGCVASTSGSAAGLWNVVNCNAMNNYICETLRAGYTPAPIVTDPPVPTSPTNQGCPIDWIGWGGNCFKVYNPDDKKSFWDAEAHCNSLGANLASFHSTEEEVYFVKNAPITNEDTFWIGLHDSSSEGGFEWTDGSVLQYTNWNSGEPNNAFQGEDCAEMFFSGAGWNDQNCDDRRGWVCKTSRVLGCEDGWLQYDDKCYAFRSELLNHEDARAACLEEQSDLVTISSPNLNTWLTSSVAATGINHWIGLHDLSDEGQFVWVDGTPLDPVMANFWDTNQPDNYGDAGEDCTVLRANGRWNDGSCTYNKPRICERPIVLCPEGWMLHQGRCYKFMDDPKTWHDAQQTCQLYQGDLAKIANMEMNAWAGKYVADNGNGHYIGLHDLTNEGRFTWTDGSQLDQSLMSLWSGAAPDDYSDGEDCAVLRPNGKWDDNRCTYKRVYICQKIGATICPTGWTAYQGDCFILKTSALNWNNARADCQADQGDLAIVNSLEMNTWLVGYVSTTGNSHWIGLHDIDREGNFIWVDGSSLDSGSPLVSLWQLDSPNNFGQGEDCVTLMPGNQKWNDIECSYKKRYICMRPYGEIPFTTAAPEYPPCPTNADWLLKGDSCYYFSGGNDQAEARQSWDGAEMWCNQNGGNLLSIHGMDEQDFVNLQVEPLSVDSHWIGIREYEVEGVYYWSDNSPVDFQFWADGEPNDFNGEEQCAELYKGDGKWNDNNCGIDRNFICRKYVNSVNPVTKPTTPAPVGNCPAGAAKFDNRCYSFYGKDEADRKSWEDAREACESLPRSKIAIIHSAPLQSFITTKLKGLDYRMWIGLSDLTSNSQFRWTDGTAVDFTNWNAGEPSESDGEEDCVEMLYDINSAGEWNDNACSKLNGYICQSYPDPALPPPLTPITTCRTGYSQYGTSCLKVIPTPMKFSDANTECKKDNVYLASIMDQYEQAFVETLLHENGGTPLWIGLVDDKVEGEYQWVDNWPVYFTHWGRSEPSRGAGEGCVAMEPNGNWNDTRCSDVYSSVCKYSTETLPTDHPDMPGTCPDNWSPYGSSCYYFLPQDRDLVEWAVGDFDCTSMGGHLASVHSRPENEFIRSNSKRTDSMWIGLYRSDAGGFSWEDGTGVDYVNWAEGEPTWQWDGEHENCVELYADRGMWNDMDCKMIKSYVCKMPKMPVTLPPGQVTDSRPATRPGGITKSPQKSTGVSTGAIVGIVLGILLAVVLIALVGIFFMTRSSKSKAPLDIGTVGFDNAMYNTNTGEVKVSDPSDVSAEA